MTTTHPRNSYEYYAPNSSNRYHCSAHFFDRLGFKSAQASSQIRTAFIVDMGNHLSSPNHRFFNRRADPEAFKTVVSDFLTQYGPKYWGDSERDHLREQDTLKGFLCPRDAQREDSTLIKVVEGFYNYKATLMRRGGKPRARKSKANPTNRHIDFHHPGAIEPSNSRKRGAALRESEEEEAGKEDSLNGVGRVESPQLDRHLADREESTPQTQILDDDHADAYGMTASIEPLLPGLRASSTQESSTSIASGNPNKKSKRSHLCREEPSTETADLGYFRTPYPDGLTPPLKSTLKHIRSSEKLLILPDGSDAGDEQRIEKPTTTSLGTSTKKDKTSATIIARGFEDVKMEPLTDDMMKQTMFLVTVHDSPIGPVPVPFTECGNFHILFPTLIEERGVSDEDARKIDSITTIFTWTGGQFGGRVGGIRKNKPGDWVYFCDSLRKAHESDADRFKGKCEVAIKLHINDRRKEHC